MKARASIAVAGLAAMLVSYSSVPVTIAEVTNTTSKIASASSGPYSGISECVAENCEDASCFGCYSVTSSGDTESSYPPKYRECIEDFYSRESVTISECAIYGAASCCSSKLYDGDCYLDEYLTIIYICYLDYCECSSEYYSCIEGADGEGSASSDSAVGEGSASSDAAMTTGSDQLSRLVCTAVLIFTITFAESV